MCCVCTTFTVLQGPAVERWETVGPVLDARLVPFAIAPPQGEHLRLSRLLSPRSCYLQSECIVRCIIIIIIIVIIIVVIIIGIGGPVSRFYEFSV
jgi:hypothetical protein